MDKIVRTIETKSGPINIRKDKDGNEYGWVPEDELEIVDTTELEYEEQTFFNNGQFTENELDLINWGLNDLLQKISKSRPKVTKGTRCPKCNGAGSHHPNCTGECPLRWTLEDDGRRKNVAKHFNEVTQQLDNIENLIEKIQEGS